jgi:regulator of protease activity HflC (stomatin/prohibitin superfamily)
MSKKPTLNLVSGGGKRLLGRAAVLGVIGVGLLALSFVWATLTVYVAPDEFAVRQVYLGPSKGVQEQLYGPGMHVVIPGYERLHKFPRDLQVLDMNDAEVRYNKDNRHARSREDYLVANAIQIQTSEGYQVTVDISVLYRVVNPFRVVTEVGAGKIYENTVVVRRADKILRQSLGRLDAEDFYNDKKRIAAAENARAELTTDLENWGIQVWGVMIREYKYDERYQQAIEQRKFQDQTVFKNQAEAVAASREAEKNRVLAEGQAKIHVESERGRAEVRKLNSDADLYYREQLAKGDLLVQLAEAKGKQMENDALKQAGASNVVGLEMAKALEGVEVIVVSTTGDAAMNPLDLDSMLEGW